MISTRALAHIITQEVPTTTTLQSERETERERGRQNQLEFESKWRWTKGDKSGSLCRAYSLDKLKLIRLGSAQQWGLLEQLLQDANELLPFLPPSPPLRGRNKSAAIWQESSLDSCSACFLFICAIHFVMNPLTLRLAAAAAAAYKCECVYVICLSRAAVCINVCDKSTINQTSSGQRHLPADLTTVTTTTATTRRTARDSI